MKVKIVKTWDAMCGTQWQICDPFTDGDIETSFRTKKDATDWSKFMGFKII